ncbi:DoxX family protein [Confluentibacter sediminis]|uniref:DoxX family protein n=1 Tax=Confluentibacter sediminis TaxID=2219045 RepID=UPI000DABA5B8|nr:DoxX family protein [Confluentibacter sediminis]
MKKDVTDLALLILRLGAGGLMLTHGIPKINMLFASPIQFADPIGVGDTLSLIFALIGEVIAPILIIIGFKTKLAAIPSVITMAVAAFIVHANDDIATKEKALLYLICFVTLLLAGAGKYSIDGMKK